MSELTVYTPEDALIKLVLDGLSSPQSKRTYKRALRDFLSWYAQQGRPGLTKAVVQAYRAKLEADGLAASTINTNLCAVRRLAEEAADNGLLDEKTANGIHRVKGVRAQGVRNGNWLTKEQAQQLLDAPDVTTLKGLRDRAILAVLLGCGLRRAEAAALTVEHVQQREGRWVIVDLVGKGNKLRTVPMPAWTKAALDAWTEAAHITEGRLFRSLRRGDHLDGEKMSDRAIALIVEEYAAKVGLSIATHDLRRTFAKLAHKTDGRLDQIQLMLGHASIKTTERYLGVVQDLQDAPCDHLGLRIKGGGHGNARA